MSKEVTPETKDRRTPEIPPTENPCGKEGPFISEEAGAEPPKCELERGHTDYHCADVGGDFGILAWP